MGNIWQAEVDRHHKRRERIAFIQGCMFTAIAMLTGAIFFVQLTEAPRPCVSIPVEIRK